MASVVYILCAIASAVCAALLTRGYRRTGGRLLLWSSWCFVFLAISNGLLMLDWFIGSRADLSLIRTIPAAIGTALMLFGLVWESR